MHRSASVEGGVPAIRENSFVKRHERLVCGCICVASAGLYCSLLIWQGLDVTDDGFHLTNQYFVFRRGLDFGFSPAWLTDILGGLWLHLSDDFGLIGARAGWVVLMTLTALASYVLCTDLYPPRRVMLGVMLAAPIATMSGQMVINYYLVPGFLLVLFVAATLPSLRDRTGDGKRFRWAAGAGVLLAACFFARGPLASAAFLPLVMWGALWIGNNAATRATVSLAILYGTALFFVLATGLALYATGYWDAYIDAVTQVSTLRSAFLARGDLSRQIARACGHFPAYFFIAAAGLLAWRLGAGRTLRWLAAALVVFSFAASITISKEPWLASYAALYFFAPVAVAVLVVRSRGCDPAERQGEKLALLATAALAPFVLTLGASGMLLKMHYGIWLLVPMLALSVSLSAADNTIPPWPLRSLQHDCYRIGLAITAAVAIAGGIYRYQHPINRDSQDRATLIAPIEHPRLAGIHTTAGRAASVTALLKAIDPWIEPGDRILAYNSIPLLYFITRTEPLLKKNWLVIRNMKTETLQRLADRICAGKATTPKIIIRAGADTRNPAWGTRNTAVTLPRSLAQLAILDAAVHRCRPELVWRDANFAVYRPKNALP